MKVLVTGGAGYIGSIVTEQLIQAGHEVVVYDNLRTGHREAVHPEATFVPGELSDANAVSRTFDQHPVDAVMHFASNTLPAESVSNPFMYIADNVTNGLNIIRAAVDHGVRRFILSSTANLFDQPLRLPIDEDERIIPGSPYGESKYLLERILYWLDQTVGLRFAALRYFNAAGASVTRGEDHQPEHHLIPLVLQVALGQRDSISVFGTDYPTPDGTCVRDYVHVLDLAQAHMLALGSLDRGSRAYNLGNGQGFSVMQVIDAAREVTGCRIPVVPAPRRPGDPAILIASSERVRRELGWAPRYPDLRAIVETAWIWHREHPHGYRRP